MNHLKYVMVSLAAVALGASVSLAAAQNGPRAGKGNQANRSERLLEKFGDQGIDADGDGVVSRDEAEAFFKGKFPGRADGTRARRAGRGFRHGGKRGLGRGPGSGGKGAPMWGALQRLEMLDSETPPTDFDLDRFPGADTDGDGVLSDSEWAAFAEKARSRIINMLLDRHPELDANDDGDVSDEEITAFKEAGLEDAKARILKMHPDADTDGDGVISDGEFQAFRDAQQEQRLNMLLEHHPEADTDGDGVLSPEEAKAFGPRRGRPGPRGPHGMRDDCPAGADCSPERILSRHPEADTNGDGELSPEEADAFRAMRWGDKAANPSNAGKQ